MAKIGNRTRITDTLLSDSLDIMNRLTNVVDMTRDGVMSWNRACALEGLDPVRAKHHCICMQGMKVDNAGNKEIFDRVMYDPYENLYMDVLNVTKLEIRLPDDYVEAVEYVLDNTGLAKPSVRMLRMSYELRADKRTYEEIGGVYGISKQAVCRNIQKVIEQMRRVDRLNILREGMTASTRLSKNKERSRRVGVLNHRVKREIIMDEHMITLINNIHSELVDTSVNQLVSLDQPTINVLLRGGKKYIADVVIMDHSAIESIPGVGRKRCSSIIAALDEYMQDNYTMYRDTFKSYWEKIEYLKAEEELFDGVHS